MNRVQENIERFPILASGIESVDFEGIANFLHLTTDCLYNMALECPITKEWWEEEWYPGSILYNDGLTLYIIIKSLQPKDIVELGTFAGMSTCFIIDAITRSDYHINSVDIWPDNKDYLNIHRGHTIKKHSLMNSNISLISDNAIHYLKLLESNSVDFIFEDTDHTYQVTKEIIEQVPRVLRKGGILISHDALMKQVNDAYNDVFGLDNCTMLTNGMILWKKK